MAKWVACGAVMLFILSGLARPEEPPPAGKIQFRFGFPPGVYDYRQTIGAETFQQMDGRDLMRDRSAMAVTFSMTVWAMKETVLLRFVPRRIEGSVVRRGFSGRYDSGGPAGAQSRELAGHLAPLLEATGVLRVGKDGMQGTGIADGFNSASGGIASMPIALVYSGEAMAAFFREMRWVLPEKPRAPGEAWQSRTAAWVVRSSRDRKVPLHVKLESVAESAAGSLALFTFNSAMPPAQGAAAGPVGLAGSEGSHAGRLLYDLDRGIVREYRAATKWENRFTMSGPAGRVEQVMGNAYESSITIAWVADDPGPLPADLAPDAGTGEDVEHADED